MLNAETYGLQKTRSDASSGNAKSIKTEVKKVHSF